MWQFLKRSPVTSAIVAAVLLLGIIGVLYGVITKAGDEGFKRVDGKLLHWDKRDLPLVCFYQPNTPDSLIEGYSIATSTINDAVGESLFRACSPWMLETKMPPTPAQGIVYLELGIAGLQTDGMTYEDESDPETGGRTVMYYDKRTGLMRGAVVQIADVDLRGKESLIFLHELLHVLGLEHDRLKDSIMFENLSGRPGGLTAKDVKLLKKAYGGIGK